MIDNPSVFVYTI